jgi:hypothetical protein
MFGEWGAILSRKGRRPVIITRCATREALIGQIDDSRANATQRASEIHGESAPH